MFTLFLSLFFLLLSSIFFSLSLSPYFLSLSLSHFIVSYTLYFTLYSLSILVFIFIHGLICKFFIMTHKPLGVFSHSHHFHYHWLNFVFHNKLSNFQTFKLYSLWWQEHTCNIFLPCCARTNTCFTLVLPE